MDESSDGATAEVVAALGEPPAGALSDSALAYRLGVRLRDQQGEEGKDTHSEPGSFAEASGRWGRRVAIGQSQVRELGEAALRATADAIGAQVGTVAERIAASLEQRSITHASAGQIGLESVELTFGLVLTAGAGKVVEAFLTAESETSAEVRIVMSRTKP
jgi:hypothetical protein